MIALRDEGDFVAEPEGAEVDRECSSWSGDKGDITPYLSFFLPFSFSFREAVRCVLLAAAFDHDERKKVCSSVNDPYKDYWKYVDLGRVQNTGLELGSAGVS
jgi:hypothetical protein